MEAVSGALQSARARATIVPDGKMAWSFTVLRLTRPTGRTTEGAAMETTSTRARLVEPSDLDAEFAAITATIPRHEIEAALSSDLPAELFLDVKRPSGDAEAEERTLSVAWEKSDLERLLAGAESEAITFSFAYDDLERAFETPDVEAHGLRERALILTVAAAAAAGGGAAAASAASDEGVGSHATPIVSQVSHGEAQTASQLVTPPANDEAGLAARGIQVGAVHDEATLASRGIEAPAPAEATHGEALTASQLVTPPANDEAGLAARGIQVGAVHDEATLASRGIEAPPAVHDEATLAARGIGAPEAGTIHDEATLVARGIQSPAPADGGSGFELPTIDAPTAAISAGIAGGIALLITAAGFSARRGRGPRPA